MNIIEKSEWSKLMLIGWTSNGLGFILTLVGAGPLPLIFFATSILCFGRASVISWKAFRREDKESKERIARLQR